MRRTNDKRMRQSRGGRRERGGERERWKEGTLFNFRDSRNAFCAARVRGSALPGAARDRCLLFVESPFEESISAARAFARYEARRPIITEDPRNNDSERRATVALIIVIGYSESTPKL